MSASPTMTSPRRSQASAGLAAVTLLAALPLLTLASCKPPIACSPGEVARKETMCPACPTIENPPPGYCPCTEGWVCRETPEHARQRRAQQRERERQQALEREATKLRADAVEAERTRVVWENRSRHARAIGHYCDPEAALGCPRDTWPRLEETEQRTPEGLPVFRQVCTPFEGRVHHPPCPDPEKEAARKLREERSIAAFARARQQCAQLTCRSWETPLMRFVCVHPPDGPEPGRHVRAEPTCEFLAKPPVDEGRIGCVGELLVEPVCQPPQPRQPGGVRRP